MGGPETEVAVLSGVERLPRRIAGGCAASFNPRWCVRVRYLHCQQRRSMRGG